MGGFVLQAPRPKGTIILILYGALLLGLSWAFGLHSVIRADAVPCPAGAPYPSLIRLGWIFGFESVIRPGSVPWLADLYPPLCWSHREVGFLAAPNWTITAVAIWPALFFALRSILDSADRTMADIDSSPMTWLAHDQPGSVAATWEANKRMLQAVTALGLLCALGWSLIEWWTNSVRPLFWHARVGDLDWSSLPATSACLQTLFALLAFLYQGVAVGLMFAFAAATVLIARTVGLHGTGEAKPPLLVDIESNDPSKRVGFERFMVLIDPMILFVGLAFANFFLTRLQNAYLRAPASGANANLWDFLRQDLSINPREDLSPLFNSSLTDFSSVAVSIGAVIALFQCFFFFNATLRRVAMQARNRSDHELVRGEPARRAEETGLDRAAVRERLQSANVWPLGYSDLLPTLSFLAISLTTIIFYRIGVYLVFLWIAGWILSRTAAGLLRR